ncbi:MAG: hypothetical protein PHR11_01470 [Candidatus Omnitrophica bacterium]|nr:hypothetical protein [Candidatus Omnitrophota bacterium]
MKSMILSGLIFCNLLALPLAGAALFAAEPDTAALTKQLSDAKDDTAARALLAELAAAYAGTHQYGEFAESLQLLRGKKKSLEPLLSYYTAEARYRQLKYLEETQNWDEYFSMGNAYRADVEKGLEAALKGLAATEPLRVRARILAFRLHKDQEDAFAEQSLADLMSEADLYARSANDPAPIKEAADTLASYGEKGKSRELYKSYFSKLTSAADISPEQLKAEADNFYAAGNAEMAEFAYETFIEKAVPGLAKDEAIKALIGIARLFCARQENTAGAYFAEQVFRKAEALGGEDIFDEELMYLRAINLEKVKEYQSCKDLYDKMLLRFPAGAHTFEATFKNGIIAAYVFADLQGARVFFEKLAQLRPAGVHAVSSMYQLGLLSQWEGDTRNARAFYAGILELAADGDFSDTSVLAAQRIKEIDTGEPLEHNLQMFLDASLKTPRTTFNASAMELSAVPYSLKGGGETRIATAAPSMETGCMQVEMQYLWSGHLGDAPAGTEQAAFSTSYKTKGTKEINLVVVSPSGVVDRSLYMVDVY